MKKLHLSLVVVLICCLVACNDSVIFDQYEKIPAKEWLYDQPVAMDVEITDTSSRYHLYVNLRHSNSYAYSNLWVVVHTTFPSGKKLENRVNLPLADKDGSWYGKGSGDIFNARVLIQPNAVFPEKGTYLFEIEQNMRLNPLPEIMEAGLSVELAESGI